MLTIELNYEWENLRGATHDVRAVELVEAMERRDMVGDLVTVMRRTRPRMQIDI